MPQAAGEPNSHPLSRRAVLATLAALPAGPALWAAAPETRLSGAALAQDIAVLRDAYTSLHPGLYRYATPAQVAKRLTRLEADWANGPLLAEAYLSLSRFAASVKCGHSYANFFNQSRAVTDALFTHIPRLPFLFRWIDGQIVITRNQGPDARISPGTIIHRINGVRGRDILARLMPYVRADGSNDAKRIALLDVRGEEAWETFDIFYGLLHPKVDHFTVEARTPDGRPFTTRLPALSLAQRRAAAPAKATADDSRWTFDWRGKTAVLTMPGWALYNSRWDWQSWLAARMAELDRAGATGLIVDLRGNEGGLDCGNDVIAHLIDQPLVVTGFDRRLRYRRAPERLRPYLDTWDRSFDTLGEDATDLGNGFYRQASNAQITIAPKGPRFRGKVAVLIEPMNSSATFQFAGLIKDHQLGLLIGSPTGGNRRGINGGAYYFLRLPASGLEIDLPLIGYFAPDNAPDAGIMPDIAVQQTAGDIAARHDRVLARALAEMG